MIDTIIKPALYQNKELSEEDKEQLSLLVEMLVADDAMKEVDLHLSEVPNDLLLTADIEGGEEDEQFRICSMAKKVKRDYYVISGLTRYYNSDTESIRKKAIENRDLLAKNLEKESFQALDEETSGLLLQYSLMGALLYESSLEKKNADYWEPCLSIIDQGVKILNDPFYRNLLPDYDWEVYEFRIYYYGSFLASGGAGRNDHGGILRQCLCGGSSAHIYPYQYGGKAYGLHDTAPSVYGSGAVYRYSGL